MRYLAYELGKKKFGSTPFPLDRSKRWLRAASQGFGDMLKEHAERAPLGRRVEVEEVGSTGVFLASDASSGITGEVIYVDCGYNIMGF